jgi:hypothetical protein
MKSLAIGTTTPPTQGDQLVKGSMYDFSDSVRQGPGAWTMIHWVAKWADGDKIKEEHACQIIEGFCIIFKCGKCSGHCTHYTAEVSPIRQSLGKPNGLFFWTVDFRNAVQRRLGRSNFYDHKTMLNIFTITDFMACTEGCGDDHAEDTPQHDGDHSAARTDHRDHKEVMGGNMTHHSAVRADHRDRNLEPLVITGQPKYIDVHVPGVQMDSLAMKAQYITPIGQFQSQTNPVLRFAQRR